MDGKGIILKVACLEEIAWQTGWVDEEQVLKLAEPLKKSGYGSCLVSMPGHVQ